MYMITQLVLFWYHEINKSKSLGIYYFKDKINKGN